MAGQALILVAGDDVIMRELFADNLGGQLPPYFCR